MNIATIGNTFAVSDVSVATEPLAEVSYQQAVPSKVPFHWKYPVTHYEMEFVGGLMGIAQDPATLCVRPEIGWAIRAR